MVKLFKLALLDLVWFAVDMVVCAVAFYLAWGMSIKSWFWWVIIGVFGRWVIHTSRNFQNYLRERQKTESEITMSVWTTKDTKENDQQSS